MQVYALVGESGTGKSHRALLVANRFQIKLLLDDGLLIRKNKILAGSSAKRESSKLMAIKRAIFFEEEHAREVREVLSSLADDRILILGTSRKMVQRITQRLHLSEPVQVIHISQVASQTEIAQARQERSDGGKHVIPVPNIEVKRNFPGYLLESLQLLLRIKNNATQLAEKTIVRPRFSWYGKLYISDNVMKELVVYTVLSFKEVAQIPKVTVEEEDERVSISFDLDLYYGCQIQEVTRRIQEAVKEVLDKNIGLDLQEVKANILSLSLPREEIQ